MIWLYLTSPRYRDIRRENDRIRKGEGHGRQARHRLAKLDHVVCPWCSRRTLKRIGFGYTECLRCGRQLQRWDEPWVEYVEYPDGCRRQVNIDGSISHAWAGSDTHAHNSDDISRRWGPRIPPSPLSMMSEEAPY